MLKFKFGVISALATVLLLAGCGGAGKVAVKPETVKSINTIAIVRIQEPQYRMMDLGSPAAAFGGVGGAAIGADAASAGKSLGGIIAAKKFQFSQTLMADLQKNLQMEGYKTVIVDVVRKEPHDLLEDYSAVNAAGADAILDVAVTNYGYVTEHFMFSPEWRPEARTHVALYVPKDGQMAYRDTLMYGYHNPIMTATDLDAPQQYQFKKRDDLYAAGDETIIAGLQDASQSIARHVALQLKR